MKALSHITETLRCIVMFTYKNRTIFDCLESILRVVSKPMPKTLLFRFTGIRYDLMVGYLDALVEKELIKTIEINKTMTYVITLKGKEYLEQWYRLRELIDYKIINDSYNVIMQAS